MVDWSSLKMVGCRDYSRGPQQKAVRHNQPQHLNPQEHTEQTARFLLTCTIAKFPCQVC